MRESLTSLDGSWIIKGGFFFFFALDKRDFADLRLGVSIHMDMEYLYWLITAKSLCYCPSVRQEQHQKAFQESKQCSPPPGFIFIDTQCHRMQFSLALKQSDGGGYLIILNFSFARQLLTI